eukprot:sb/3468339/
MGYSRVFTLSYVSFEKDLTNIEEIKQSFENVTAQCHRRNIFLFYDEMRHKRATLPEDAEHERNQVDWWLGEIRKSETVLTNDHGPLQPQQFTKPPKGTMRSIAELLVCYRLCLGAHLLTLTRPTFEEGVGDGDGGDQEGFHLIEDVLKCSIDGSAPDFLSPLVDTARKTGMVARYADNRTGMNGILSRMWGVSGDKELIPFDRAVDLWKYVKYSLVSELGSEIMYKFYKILTDKQGKLVPRPGCKELLNRFTSRLLPLLDNCP